MHAQPSQSETGRTILCACFVQAYDLLPNMGTDWQKYSCITPKDKEKLLPLGVQQEQFNRVF
jgi:hypothetical protein